MQESFLSELNLDPNTQIFLKDILKTFSTSIETDPNNFDAYIQFGFSLYHQSHFGYAASVFRKAISLQPQSADAHNRLGEALYSESRLEEAIEAYSTAISINPVFTDAYLNLAHTFNRRALSEKALEVCYKAQELEPKYPGVYICLSNILCREKNKEKSRNAFNTATSLLQFKEDSSPECQGIPEADIKELNEIPKHRGLNATSKWMFLYYRMACYFELREIMEEGLKACSTAIEGNPRSIVAYFTIGFAKNRDKKYEEAREAYESVIRINPRQPDGYYNLGCTLDNQQKLEEVYTCL